VNFVANLHLSLVQRRAPSLPLAVALANPLGLPRVPVIPLPAVVTSDPRAPLLLGVLASALPPGVENLDEAERLADGGLSTKEVSVVLPRRFSFIGQILIGRDSGHTGMFGLHPCPHLRLGSG